MKPSALAAMMFAMMAGGPAGMAANASNTTAVNRDMLPLKQAPITKRQERTMTDGSWDRIGHPSGRFLNQRQYRNLCRQNPHLYKSKKHRSKN